MTRTPALLSGENPLQLLNRWITLNGKEGSGKHPPASTMQRTLLDRLREALLFRLLHSELHIYCGIP